MCKPNAQSLAGEPVLIPPAIGRVPPVSGPNNAYENNLTRGNPRVTARLPEEPVRVTSWLAGWVDYVFAIVLVAGRWVCAPFARTSNEPVMLSAFAPAMADSFVPRRQDANDEPSSGRLVKAAEIVMLSLSFFLAAHLLSGGTQTVTAPDLNHSLLRIPRLKRCGAWNPPASDGPPVRRL